jgi:hypothetical protein
MGRMMSAMDSRFGWCSSWSAWKEFVEDWRSKQPSTSYIFSSSLVSFSVNAFYRVNQEPPDTPSSSTANDLEWTRQAREFKIGSIGFADSSGILLASLLAMPTEIQLCKGQVKRGKLFCKGL